MNFDQQTTEFVVGLLRSDLYQADHNLVFSPYSLISALVMVMLGARGKTQAQLASSMFDTVKVASDRQTNAYMQYVDAFARANNETMQRNEQSLKIANFLYSSKE